MASSSSALSFVTESTGGQGPITVKLIELRGLGTAAACQQLGWLLLRSEVVGEFEDLYCSGLRCDVPPQFQHTIHHRQYHSYAEFYKPSPSITTLSFSLSPNSTTTGLRRFYCYVPWPISVYSPSKRKWGLWYHHSDCSIFHLNKFWKNGRFLWNLVARLCRWMWPRCHTFQSHTFNHSEMANVHSSEVEANLASVNIGSWNFVGWQILKSLTNVNKTIFVRGKKHKH
jgi:hypothetical protein